MPSARPPSNPPPRATSAADAAKPELRVFYSWQSDRPDTTNRALIRAGLREASSRLEAEVKGLHVVIDEATRELPGSPNIPQAIFDKIRAADVFVGDVTTISEPGVPRPCPNPNVLVELGYAVAWLGWPRLVMVFNEAFGAFPSDLPFDIDRHRALRYEFPSAQQGDSERRERKARLVAALHAALKAIVEARPQRPSEAEQIAPELMKRRRDVQLLRELLGTISLGAMDHWLDRIQIGRIPGSAFHMWYDFNAICYSASFHLYDQKLNRLVGEFLRLWGSTFSFGEHFMPSQHGDEYIWPLPGDVFRTVEEEKAWKRLQEAVKKSRTTFNALLKYVRSEYVEIDLRETSAAAWRGIVESRQERDRIVAQDSEGTAPRGRRRRGKSEP